jgi:putative endopeptidase
VIGHELTHAFGDRGRQLDGTGKLRDWWSPASAAELEQRTRCLVDLFSRQQAAPGLFVDGLRTLDENLADLGGLNLAFDVLNAVTPQPPPVMDLDAAQQFFVSYAQTACTVMRPELLSILLALDPHSPPKSRVNVPLSQMDSFADAFHCPAGSPMRPRPACAVW